MAPVSKRWPLIPMAGANQDGQDESDQDEGEVEGETSEGGGAQELKSEPRVAAPEVQKSAKGSSPEGGTDSGFQLELETTRSDQLKSYRLEGTASLSESLSLGLGGSYGVLTEGSQSRGARMSLNHTDDEGLVVGFQAELSVEPEDLRSWALRPSLTRPLWGGGTAWSASFSLVPEAERTYQTVEGKRGRSKTNGTLALGGTLGLEQRLGERVRFEASYQRRFFVGTVPGKLQKLRRATTSLIAGLPSENASFGASWEFHPGWTLSAARGVTESVLDSVEGSFEETLSHSLGLETEVTERLSMQLEGNWLTPETSEASFQWTLGGRLSW